MVLGIVSLALFCILYISIPCAIVSLILGFVGKSASRKADAKNGPATAGIVCSVVFLAIAALCITYFSVYYDEIVKSIL